MKQMHTCALNNINNCNHSNEKDDGKRKKNEMQ